MASNYIMTNKFKNLEKLLKLKMVLEQDNNIDDFLSFNIVNLIDKKLNKYEKEGYYVPPKTLDTFKTIPTVEEISEIIDQEAERKARKEKTERKAREAKSKTKEADRKAKNAERREEEAERRNREEAKLAREEEARLAREQADRIAREDAERRAREEEARLAREEADRQAREEADRRAREEADRRAREEAERRNREEADRLAREEEARRNREEAERLAREEEARRAREEAERRSREEAERRNREEAERRNREEAERRTREDADRLVREEVERRKREEMERLDREAAERRTREEAERRTREDADRLVREEVERRKREEMERLDREAAERKAREAEAEQSVIEATQQLAKNEENKIISQIMSSQNMKYLWGIKFTIAQFEKIFTIKQVDNLNNKHILKIHKCDNNIIENNPSNKTLYILINKTNKINICSAVIFNNSEFKYDDFKSYFWELGSFCINNKLFKGKGYDDYLLNHILDNLPNNCNNIWLSTASENTASMYSLFGFSYLRNEDTFIKFGNKVINNSPNVFNIVYKKLNKVPTTMQPAEYNKVKYYKLNFINQMDEELPNIINSSYICSSVNILYIMHAIKNVDYDLFYSKEITRFNKERYYSNIEQYATILNHVYANTLNVDSVSETFFKYENGKITYSVKSFSNELRNIYNNNNNNNNNDKMKIENLLTAELNTPVNHFNLVYENNRAFIRVPDSFPVSENFPFYRIRDNIDDLVNVIQMEETNNMHDFLKQQIENFISLDQISSVMDENSLNELIDRTVFKINRIFNLIMNLKERKNYALPIQILNYEENHWYACVILKLNDQYYVYYIDSIEISKVMTITTIADYIINANIRLVALSIIAVLSYYYATPKDENKEAREKFINRILEKLKNIQEIAIGYNPIDY